jgi:hypothetical protein
MPRPPHPRACFFKQAVFQGQVGHGLLQRLCFTAQILHLAGCRRARRVASQPALAGIEELFRPAVVHRRGDSLAPTQLGDALLPAHAFQYDADLFFGRELPARRSPNVLHDLLCRCFLRPGFLSHLRSMMAAMIQKSSVPENP